MKNNPVIKYLSRYRTINLSINNKLEEISYWRNVSTRMSPSGRFEDKGGSPGDKVGDIVSKIIDLENQINAEIDELIIVRDEIKSVIYLVGNEKYRSMLEMRYLSTKQLSWEEIAENLDKDVRTVHRWHGNSLKIIEKNLKMSLNFTIDL